MDQPLAILVEVTDPSEGAAAVVISGAMQLFTPDDPVEIVLYVPGVDEVDEPLGLAVQTLCLDGGADALPETVLVGAAEAAGREAALVVRTGRSAVDAARAVAMLTTLAGQLTAPAAPEPSGRLAVLEAWSLRAQVELRAATREPAVAVAVARGLRRPRVALVFQHRGYWNAVATVLDALRADPRIDLVVVALDSEADGKEASTGAFLREQGVSAVSAEALQAQLDDVDVVLLDNPYDETRPPWLAAGALADRGIRLAMVPYGYGAIAGPLMDNLLWDMPLMQLAWRSYVPTAGHKVMYDHHCRTGSEHVRVVGSAKLDRLLAPVPSARAEALRAHAGERSIVLWNPHFRLGPGGWSTFDEYFEPVLRWFLSHPDVVLLLRPHFRLFRDLSISGGDASKVEATIRALAQDNENLLLDEDPDYVPSLTVADAMMSDLSSLASEYLVLGRPLLYLHREDGPGPNALGQHFSLMEWARDEADVKRWLAAVRMGNAARPDAGAVTGTFGTADGRAGERIAADLVTSLLERVAPVVGSAVAGRVVRVSAATLGDQGTVVAVESPVEGLQLAWRSERWTGQWCAVGDGRAVLPSSGTAFGGPELPLPSDSYRLVASGPDGELAVEVADDVEGGAYRNDRVAVTLSVAAVDELRLRVEPPQDRDSDSTRALEQASYPVARSRPLEHTVLFTSYAGTAAACSPRAISDRLAAVEHDAVRYWVVDDLSVELPPGCSPVVRGSREHYERAASARWVVDNEAMPDWLDKRPGQTLLQTWHGTPLKKLRWDLHEAAEGDTSFMREVDRDAASWDYVLSPNPHSSEVLRRAFRVQGEVLELGYPRNDCLADPLARRERASLLRRRLGLDPEVAIVLHAPTWRGRGVRRAARSGSDLRDPQPLLDPHGVLEALGGEGVLLYRGHRFVASAAAELRQPGVLDVSRYPDMSDLLAAADVLVTDYSSSLFDMTLTGAPMVLFAHDLEEYRDRERGLYFDMESELPAPVVQTADEVSEWISKRDLLPRQGEGAYDAFVRRFAPWDDGRAAARVVDTVFR